MEPALLHEYFYKRLTDIDEEISDLVYAMRTKKTLILACERIRELDLEKAVLVRVYNDLRLIL